MLRRAMWLYRNYSANDIIVRVVRHPKVAFRYFLRQKLVKQFSPDDIQNLAKILGSTEKNIRNYISEILNNKEEILQCFGYTAVKVKEQILYCIVRCLKPEKVVETGVFYGFSTYMILRALNRNDYGHLYSIDLPAYYDSKYIPPKYRLPKNKQPGFIVPNSLKDRWELLIGKTKERLPFLLKKLGSIDIFIHDSEHTYDNMMFEYETTSRYIRKGGILFSDDITWNNSFDDFISKYALQYLKFKSEEEVGLCIHP